jgi:hypothetical protein
MSIVDIIKSMFDVSVTIFGGMVSSRSTDATPSAAKHESENWQQEPNPRVTHQRPPMVRFVSPEQNPNNEE